MPTGTRSPIRITLEEVERGDQPDRLFALPQGTRAVNMSKMPSSMQGGEEGGILRP